LKRLLIPLFLVLLIPIIPFSDASLNLADMQLISNDDSIILEFGENTETTSFLKSRITPNLEFGIIRVSDQEFLLDSSDPVSVRILGNSIVVKSFEPTVLLYARSIGSNNYSVSVYTFDGGFQKQTYTATLESITDAKIEQITEKEQFETKQDVVIAVSNPRTTQAAHVYTLTVRVYDPVINPTADIQKQEGYLEGINVKIEILDPEGNIFETVTGETDNKGYFTFEHKVIQNVDRFGEYTFTIMAGNQISEGSAFFEEEEDDGVSCEFDNSC